MEGFDIATITLYLEMSLIVMNFHTLYLGLNDNILNIFKIRYITQENIQNKYTAQ